MSGGLATAISTHMRAVTEPMQSWTWRDNFAGQNAVRQNHPASALLLVTSSNTTPACFLCGHACAMSLLCAHMHSLTSLIPCLPCPPPSVNTKTLVLAETAFPPWQLLTMSKTPHAGCQTNPVQGWQQPGHTCSALHPKPEHGSVGSITYPHAGQGSFSLNLAHVHELARPVRRSCKGNEVQCCEACLSPRGHKHQHLPHVPFNTYYSLCSLKSGAAGPSSSRQASSWTDKGRCQASCPGKLCIEIVQVYYFCCSLNPLC